MGLDVGGLWLRSRASVLLLEGHWLESPGLHVEVSLGKTLNSKLNYCMSLYCTVIYVFS